MQDAADHATVVHAIFAAHIRRQVRLDLTPLLIAQPKQVVPHPNASRITKQRNHQLIQPTMTLLSVGPRTLVANIAKRLKLLAYNFLSFYADFVLFRFGVGCFPAQMLCRFQLLLIASSNYATAIGAGFP
ncbi:MAG TPA: hypothetical protein VGC27_01520 [Rhizomicrobium sp.]